MNVLHLEYGGKAARLGFTSLPDAKPKPALTQQTGAGAVIRCRVFNGRRPIKESELTAEAVIEGDPELDFERGGTRLEVETTAAYFNPDDADPRPVGDFQEIDLVLDPEGNEKERRPHLSRKSNLDTIHPIKMAKRFPIQEALTSFVFRGCHQLVHEDGLAHDFLFGIAEDLHGKREMVLLGAGPKGNQPLVVREKGSPYRAFLYGEIKPNTREYKLVVMLSDQELKLPAEPGA